MILKALKFFGMAIAVATLLAAELAMLAVGLWMTWAAITIITGNG